jgi:hypothetical protein
VENLKVVKDPKIQTFIETYHKPYTPKHRYWTGLLLIVRVVLYLVATTNVSNDPTSTIALTAISFTECCIFVLTLFFGSRLYRKWPVDVLETFFYLNTLSFVLFTWYSLNSPNSNRKAAAFTSVAITFIVLLLIILYHVYTYTSVFSKIYKTKLGRMIDRLFTDADPKPKPEPSPPDDDIHRFNKLLDVIDRPVNTYDYKKAVKQQEPCSEAHPCSLWWWCTNPVISQNQIMKKWPTRYTYQVLQRQFMLKWMKQLANLNRMLKLWRIHD